MKHLIFCICTESQINGQSVLSALLSLSRKHWEWSESWHSACTEAWELDNGRIFPYPLFLVWESDHREKKSEPRFPMKLAESNYFYYLSQLNAHFWVHWHSSKMLHLAQTLVQLSQLLGTFSCRGIGSLTCPFLWFPLTMIVANGQEQIKTLGIINMFPLLLQWDKGR